MKRAGIGLLVGYGLVSALFTWVSRDGGMLTPETAPLLMVVAVGLAAIAMRLLVLFVVLPVLVWRLARG